MSWTKDEQEKFIDAVREHGRNWKKIADIVSTKDINSVRSHAIQMRIKFEKHPELEGADIVTILKSSGEKRGSG